MQKNNKHTRSKLHIINCKLNAAIYKHHKIYYFTYKITTYTYLSLDNLSPSSNFTHFTFLFQPAVNIIIAVETNDFYSIVSLLSMLYD